jgi:hypothetical protein
LNPLPIAATADALLPLLEPACRNWQLKVQRQLKHEVELGAVRRRFNAELNIALVLDAPEALRLVSPYDVKAIGLGEAHLMDRAFQNLHARSTQAFIEVKPGLYLSPYDDSYDAARLVLPRLLEGLKLVGDPVAFIPNRSTLIITGSNDAEGLLGAVELVASALKKSTERVSTMALKRTDFGWESWLPPSTNPARAALEQLVHEQLGDELSHGGEMLGELLPQCAQPTIGTRPSADGTRREVVVVLSEADGSEVLVPRADEIVTADGVSLPWAEFARQNNAALTQVEGSNGEWYRLLRS